MININVKTFVKPANVNYWFSWVAISLLYVVIRLNVVNIPLDSDEGIFGYIGQLILNHGLPYRDVFEHKPPVVFYLNALALLFVKPTASGIHIFLHVYNFLTLISLFFLSKIYFRSSSAGLWTAMIYAIFSAEPAIQGFTASSEMFMLLPITLSLLLAVLAVNNNNLIYFTLSGVTGALACWTKQSAIFIVIFILLYFISAQIALRNKQFITIARSIIAWSFGALGISLVIGAYFYHYGAFKEFVYWSFIHSALYLQSSNLADRAGTILVRIKDIAKADFILIGMGLEFGFISILKKSNYGWFILGFMFFSFLGTIAGNSYPHYFAQIAPAVAVAAGYGFSCCLDMVTGNKRRAVARLLAAMLIIAVPVIVNSEYYLEKSPNKIVRNFFGYKPFSESVELAQYIAQRTTPEDTVFIFGAEAQILLYAQRKSATSYVLIYPLMNAFPRYKEFQNNAWAEIINNLPEYILFVNMSTTWGWDGKADLWIYHQTRQLISQSYHPEALMTIEGEKGDLVTISKMTDTGKLNHYSQQPAIFIYRKNIKPLQTKS